MNIYELSQRAKELYLKAKAKGMVDEQRALIKFIFATLTVDGGKLSYTYSKTFKILSEAVSATNGSNVDKLDGLGNGKFEPSIKSDITGQNDSLLPSRPIWLPDSRRLRITISTILKAFEDLVQVELLKVRWEEIKRLQQPFVLSTA